MIEYLRAKNEIIYEATGIVLVPEEQIKEVDCRVPLSTIYDVYTCPYCIKNIHEEELRCEECIMEKSGNGCLQADSTYNQVRRKLAEIAGDGGGEIAIMDIRSVVAKDIAELIYRYNRELKKEK